MRNTWRHTNRNLPDKLKIKQHSHFNKTGEIRSPDESDYFPSSLQSTKKSKRFSPKPLSKRVTLFVEPADEDLNLLKNEKPKIKLSEMRGRAMSIYMNYNGQVGPAVPRKSQLVRKTTLFYKDRLFPPESPEQQKYRTDVMDEATEVSSHLRVSSSRAGKMQRLMTKRANANNSLTRVLEEADRALDKVIFDAQSRAY